MVIATPKRITFTGGGTTRKKGDPTKEMDAALLALDGPVDEDVCWEVYHLDEDNCVAHVPPQSKPRNCKPNPYCIHRLGIEKFTKLLQSKDSGDAVEAMVRRDPAIQPCGLVNYGNYCYVNSFLQIWFNNLRFRQCVYEWRTDPDWKKPADAKFDIQAVMGCLQRLFLTLQFTPFETTDAREFIKLLRLDDQQQDIQEFHTLFFDNVERALAPHPNGRPIRDTIQQLFLSRMNQTMNCDCGYESATGTEYRSLPIIIEGYNSLPPAIQNFFRPENVADYKCSKCGRVGYMIKGVNFDALPQVLIIQLNRYIYDNAKGRHRKLNTPISYPRVLKAELLQPGAADNDEYELCAVMIHDGQSAQSGHYYDIIREPSTKQWFTYNDRHVQLEKKAPGYEENKEPKEGGKSTADQRGCYALIYQRKAIGNERGEHNDALRMPPVEDVQAVRFKLERDFEHQSKAGSRTRRLWEHRIVQRHAFLSQLFNDLEVKNGHDLFDEPETIAFIPTSLLVDVFAKEFAAVKDMHNLDIEAAPMDAADLSPPRAENKGCSSNSNVKLKKSKEDGESRSGSGSAKSMRQQKDNNVDDNQEQEEDDLLDANFDYSAYEHIYAPEPPKEVHFVLCKHGHVPLDAVLRGELKAVKTKGARRMIKELAVQFYVHRPKEMMAAAAAPSSPSKAPPKKDLDKPSTSAFVQEWDRPAAAAEVPTKDQQQQGGPPAVEAAEDLYVVDRRLRTGDDLCTECVEALRTEALFREQLHQIDLLMADTMRTLYLRTFDPNRVTPNPPREPPADAVWVSCEHLKQYKKIATAQMQQDGRLNYERGGEEPTEKRAKNSDDEAEDAEASSGSQDDNNNNVQLQLIEVMASTNTGTNRDDDGYPFDDPEQQMAGTSLDGRISAEVLAVDAEMARMAAAGDAHSPPIEEMEASIKDETPATAAAVDDDQPPRFNDKLYCKHGNLSTVSKRVWLRKNEWNLLAQNLRHFDEPFPCTAQECHECREESQDLEQVRQYSMNQLQGLIDAITPLLKRITGRKWESHELGQMYPYILCKKFVDQTRSIISKAKQKGHVEIPRICQDCLLCKEHGLPFLVFHAPQQPAAQDGGILGILFSGLVKNKSDEEESIAIPLFSTEWEQLLQAYRTHVPEYPEPRAILFLENGQCPDFCDNCHYQHNIDEEARRFIYPEGADIYVKSKGDESEDQLQAKATSSSSTTSTMTTRRGAQKDMHKIKMRSDQTVMDLKMELMHKTNQSPNDQLLYLDDRVLDNQMTLEQALVAPNNQENPLILIVQQRQQQDDSESGGAAEGSGRRRRPLEKGFKDTALS